MGEHEGYYLGAGAPLSNAAATGRMDIVQLLLDHGADPNLPEEQYAPKGKALYPAVYHGHYEIAKLLLERGAFPNPPVESSGNALWVSREWRPDKRMEELLLSTGPRRSRSGPRGLARAGAQLAPHLAAAYCGSGWRREEGETTSGRRRGFERAR